MQVDEVLPVKTGDAKEMARRIAREEALFAGDVVRRKRRRLAPGGRETGARCQGGHADGRLRPEVPEHRRVQERMRLVSPPDVPDEDEPAAADLPAGVHRQVYETFLRQLPSGERAAQARTAEEPDLSAFCFDPLPAVIHALLDNPRFGLPQARLVAAHHGTPSGLEAL